MDGAPFRLEVYGPATGHATGLSSACYRATAHARLPRCTRIGARLTLACGTGLPRQVAALIGGNSSGRPAPANRARLAASAMAVTTSTRAAQQVCERR